MKSIVLVFAALALAVGCMAPPARAAGHAPAPAAPAFSLPTTAGSVALDSLRGHVALVDFWASWCTPCRQSFPWMADLQRRYAAAGLRIVAVNVDKDRSAAAAFLDHYPAPFTVAFDPAGRTASAFRVKGMPSSFLIDGSGHIVYAHVGFDTKRAAALEAAVRQAVGS